MSRKTSCKISSRVSLANVLSRNTQTMRIHSLNYNILFWHLLLMKCWPLLCDNREMFFLSSAHGKCWLIGLLFHMTQLISRNNTKSHHAKK